MMWLQISDINLYGDKSENNLEEDLLVYSVNGVINSF